MKRLNKVLKLIKINVFKKKSNQTEKKTKTKTHRPKPTLLQKRQTTLGDRGERSKQNTKLVTNYFL